MTFQIPIASEHSQLGEHRQVAISGRIRPSVIKQDCLVEFHAPDEIVATLREQSFRDLEFSLCGDGVIERVRGSAGAVSPKALQKKARGDRRPAGTLNLSS